MPAKILNDISFVISLHACSIYTGEAGMSTGTALFIYLFFQNLKETEKLINGEKLVHCNVELSIIMQKALGRGNKSYTF